MLFWALNFAFEWNMLNGFGLLLTELGEMSVHVLDSCH